MDFFTDIVKPTLVLNPQAARENIFRMAGKARSQRIGFRPHFKTHMSAAIGEWFFAAGVSRITVSSVDMAIYFALHGWDDITIAFPLNVRQMDAISTLARTAHVGLLVETVEGAAVLHQRLKGLANIWIKIDAGSHRTGLAWDRPEAVKAVIDEVQRAPNLALRGLLTHSGQTYKASSAAEIGRIYAETRTRLHSLRDALGGGLELSVGDTPACSVVEDLSGVDEIRPGNFVFYDAQQYLLGSCAWEQVAVAVACPVVALHPERQEAVIYGGAIHLSKDTIQYEGRAAYGLVARPEKESWGSPLEGAYVQSLSQEHGVVHIPAAWLKKVRVGSLLFVIPAHSCLAVAALGRYRTLAGEAITTMMVEP